MVHRTSRAKVSDARMKTGSVSDPDSDADQALRLSRRRMLSPATFLKELALRPDFIEGVQLGELLTPQPLRRHGQWVVRSQDLLSFNLELSNLHALPSTSSTGSAPTGHHGSGRGLHPLHFAPQAIAERVFFAASPSVKNEKTATWTNQRGNHLRPPRPHRWSPWHPRRLARASPIQAVWSSASMKTNCAPPTAGRSHTRSRVFWMLAARSTST